MQFRTLCVATAALAAVAGSASAAVLQLDINAMTVNANGAFNGLAHTGTLTLGQPNTGMVVDVLVDGQSFGGNAITDFAGEIELTGGQVTGGFLSLTGSDGSVYEATIASGEGQVNTQAGQGYRIDGLTFDGFFQNLSGGTDFLGVDIVALFGGVDELEGSFLLHKFGPNANGFDNNADIDIYVVPSPGAIALAGLAGLTLIRRRR